MKTTSSEDQTDSLAGIRVVDVNYTSIPSAIRNNRHLNKRLENEEKEFEEYEEQAKDM